MDLLGPKTAVLLSVCQAGATEPPCNPGMCLASSLILPLLASLCSLSTSVLHPTDTPCDAEWSSRIAAPRDEDQGCLNFFHPHLSPRNPLSTAIWRHLTTATPADGLRKKKPGLEQQMFLLVFLQALEYEIEWQRSREIYLLKQTRLHDNFVFKSPTTQFAKATFSSPPYSDMRYTHSTKKAWEIQ